MTEWDSKKQFWKQYWWQYLIFVGLVTAHGNLYGSWWSLIPGILVMWWWIELAEWKFLAQKMARLMFIKRKDNA